MAVSDALLTLIRSVDATMGAAGLALTSSKTPEDTSEPIIFSGETDSVELSFTGDVMTVLCKSGEKGEKSVAEVLFAPEEDDWDDRDTKSSANAVNDAVSGFFGTELILAGKAPKAQSSAKGGKSAKVIDASEVAAVKAKKNKSQAETYDEISLANRMETIFPDLKGEMIKNIDKYDIFLPEEYFETLVTPKIIEAAKLNDRPVLKKVFNSFNTYYEEGENNIQSLIVVSILGINLAKDDNAFQNCEPLMEENLHDAVVPVIEYLKTNNASKRISDFTNPKPVKAKK